MKRRELFPPIEPYQTGWLKVDALHTLYWEVSGNPQGVPVVFLHGGPGAGKLSFSISAVRDVPNLMAKRAITPRPTLWPIWKNCANICM
jgi:pimeloyl-ACP methyl ester carboxylesterase